MKYELIKDYPGSPKLGTVVESEIHNGFSLKDYPGNWKPVQEKLYEIISFKNIQTHLPKEFENGIVARNSKNLFGYTFELEIGEATEQGMLEAVAQKKFVIHSIKRLSDGEVFTVGDIVKHNTLNRITIEYITNIGNTIAMHGPIVGITGSGHYQLKSIEKVKSVFKTCDNAEISIDDLYYYVNTETLKVKDAICTETSGSNPNHLYFSTEEAANNYVFLNAKTISRKELLDVIEDLSNPEVDKSLLHLIVESLKYYYSNEK